MKLTLKKISEEKFEIKITNENEIIFSNINYFNYMGEEMVNMNTINDTITQLTNLFGEFTEIENDFDL